MAKYRSMRIYYPVSVRDVPVSTLSLYDDPAKNDLHLRLTVNWWHGSGYRSRNR
ncbi:hypothetical protein [Streptomyces sp. NPDC059063]|uniref:hypothetical protein n=1 Tax=unclassified Streptomyces TaxID=2593676 RepID=UPI0036B09DF6